MPANLEPRLPLQARGPGVGSGGAGADRTLCNNQDKVLVNLCQPMWSHGYRFTREVLA